MLILESLLDQTDICSAILHLENDATVPLIADVMESYEEYNSDHVASGKVCRKLFTGGVPFSPDLTHHLNLINY